MGILQTYRTRTNSRLITFLLCILVSAFLWIFSSLSKEYTTTVELPVSYSNFPGDKISPHQLTRTVRAQVRAKGFSLLNFWLSRDSVFVPADLSKVRKEEGPGKHYLELSSALRRMNDENTRGMLFVRFIPDTLYFNFQNKSSKEVPVKIISSLSFKEPFQAVSALECTPFFITISGTQKALDKMDTLYTQVLQINDIAENVDTLLQVRAPGSTEPVEFSPKEVRVRVRVDQFTEKEVEVPVEVQHIPPGYSIKLFPDRVKLVFRVPFAEYENVKPENFRVIADYVLKTGENKLLTELKEAPAFVKQAKTIPSAVEFILVKE